jgi:carboxyl-terminal processing protease
MQENNKSNWFTPISYAIVLVIGLGLGVFFKGDFSLSGMQKEDASPMQEIINIVKSKYVEAIASDSLNTKLADYYLSHLDPHSVYIPPSELTPI